MKRILSIATFVIGLSTLGVAHAANSSAACNCDCCKDCPCCADGCCGGSCEQCDCACCAQGCCK